MQICKICGKNREECKLYTNDENEKICSSCIVRKHCNKLKKSKLQIYQCKKCKVIQEVDKLPKYYYCKFCNPSYGNKKYKLVNNSWILYNENKSCVKCKEKKWIKSSKELCIKCERKNLIKKYHI
ncbi:MAG: hypothetical protein CMF62_03260 [Magnetococcales bacterium]|nr:hypothetical protein [Magnetococcales bacterium]|tara:strand:- start:560 stop:934 length:375 start_codon:yes stop_codon:yes gene_type:complete